MKEILLKAGEKARWDAYFALDLIKGGKVRKKYNKDLEALAFGSDEKVIEERIEALLSHAVKTTDYYKNCDPKAGLSSFPLVDKQIWRDHYNEFLSSAYKGAKDNRVMTTSGSTGTPFSMTQDRGKIVKNTADSIFLSEMGGYRIGDKIAFIRVWVDNVKKSRLQLTMENSIMMESSSLNDGSIKGMLETIRKQGVSVLTGYASALGEISRYIDRTGYDLSGFRVHAILPISESMPAPVRQRLQEQFGCPVCAYYSNEENGIMGMQHKDDAGYYINTESYYYELLKLDSDEPCEDGELGRIVITDLNNYAFPVIRYDNGDTARAKFIRKNGRVHLTLTELYGRRSDILYDTKGGAVTPYVITNNLWDVEGVDQYRFLQLGEKEYKLLLNGDREKMDVENMLARIRPAFGEDAEIIVEYVDEIPVLASGKRKYIENLWKA